MPKKRGNNEGTIYRRKDGRWCGMVTIGRKSDGKLKRVTFYGKTKQEVVEKVTKAISDLKQGTFFEPRARSLWENG